MARNKYAGTCYYCKGFVPSGAGHFEWSAGGTWRTIHTECAIRQREEKKANGLPPRL